MSTPTALLYVLAPQAIAVPAAAESVTRDVAELVRVVAWYGRWLQVSSPRPISRENSSATMRWGTEKPSPMNMNTYFGPPAHAAADSMHETPSAAILI